MPADDINHNAKVAQSRMGRVQLKFILLAIAFPEQDFSTVFQELTLSKMLSTVYNGPVRVE